MIQNREAFLQTIATQLGHDTPTRVKPERKWKHQPQLEVLKDATPDELVEIMIEQCKSIHTTIKICTQSSLPQTLQEVFDTYENGLIIYSEDDRLDALNISNFITAQNSKKWNSIQEKDPVRVAEQANIGIVVSDVTLAESATIMLQSSPSRGRALSFLPQNSIAIIPKSTIVPRMTQAAQFLRTQEHVSSCINFITGPSNSADIEMNLVVGVHGPVRMTYIVVEDY